MKKTVLILLIPLLIIAAIVSGEVTAVTDGDTIKVMVNGVEKKIRLYGVDTPEKRGNQPYWKEARDFTNEYCMGKNVTLDVKNTDRYGRTIAWVFVEGKEISLNEALVENGLAWWYEYYAKRDYNLRDAEIRAKKKKLGIWGASVAPINPYLWRKGQR